jgi:hypothetical protein
VYKIIKYVGNDQDVPSLLYIYIYIYIYTYIYISGVLELQAMVEPHVDQGTRGSPKKLKKKKKKKNYMSLQKLYM